MSEFFSRLSVPVHPDALGISGAYVRELAALARLSAEHVEPLVRAAAESCADIVRAVAPVHFPAKLCLPPRTAIREPWLRANSTARTTSFASAQRTIAAGRRSIAALVAGQHEGSTKFRRETSEPGFHASVRPEEIRHQLIYRHRVLRGVAVARVSDMTCSFRGSSTHGRPWRRSD